jgi:hypothetical protein
MWISHLIVSPTDSGTSNTHAFRRMTLGRSSYSWVW